MSRIDIKQHIFPIYFIIAIFLQIELTIQNILLVCIPILIVSFSIYLKNKKLGLICTFLFYTVSLPQIFLSTMEDVFLVFIEIIFLVLPSIYLLSWILQLENPEIFYLPVEKKPLLVAIALIIVIMTIFYLFTIVTWEGFLFSSESIQGQTIMLTALSLIVCTPLLFIQKIRI